MATANNDGSIVLSTKIDQSGLKKGFSLIVKSFAAIGVAAAGATAAITKMAVSAYADYEQLVGGVETLFKGSADKVKAYASDAFFTTGMSANEYMQNVTSFSASLISSLAGDTEKAADVANMALIDISDNANKMGSSLESVTLAYQGFAKGQYMLLDNLKLGYGGTKTEMERLLKDAEAYLATQGKTAKFSLDNLADVYTAINAIQQKLDIAGTTAKEAEKTISGSANMMKASWQNVLTAIAGGGDLDRAINNLVYSVSKYFGNITPVVQRSLVGIGALIEQIAPMLVQSVASALIQSIPNLVNAAFQMVVGLAKGIWQGLKALFTGGSGGVTSEIKASVGGVASSIEEASTGMDGLGNATEKAGKKAQKSLAAFDELNTMSTDAGGDAVGGVSVGGLDAGASGLGDVLGDVNTLQNSMGGIFSKISSLAQTLWQSKPVQNILSIGRTMFDSLRNSVNKWGKPVLSSIKNLFSSIGETISPSLEIIQKACSDFISILSELWDEHAQPIADNIGLFVENTIALFQKIHDNVLEPIITPFLEKLSSLWDTHISKLVKAVGDFVAKLVNGALTIYNKFIVPIINWLLDKFKPIWESVSEIVVNLFGNVVEFIATAAQNIIGVLTSVVDFLVNVFTGDWEGAWESVKDIFGGVGEFFSGVWDGIKNVFGTVADWFEEKFSGAWNAVKGVFSTGGEIFSGIVDGVVSTFKSIVNALIDGINSVVSVPFKGLNTVLDTIQDISILGVSPFDWLTWRLPIPEIPHLARGAVLPPNKPFLSVVGDQRSGTNIEAPLDTIVEAMNIALNNNQNGFGGTIEVPVIVDGREIMRAVRSNENVAGRQTVFGGFANAY